MRYDPESLAVIPDWAEYTGLSRPEIDSKIAACLRHSAEEWNTTVNVSDPKSVQQFYTQTDYIYEVLQAYTPEFRQFKFPQLEHALNQGRSRLPQQARVLDFGGGTGELCLWLSTYFEHVTYVDLPGKLMDFAKWRFKKYGINVEMIEVSTDRGELPEDKFDMVFSDAALEHVIDLNYWLELLVYATRPGGYLLLVIDHCQSADYPMHISAHHGPELLMWAKGAPEIGRQLYVKADGVADHFESLRYRIPAWFKWKLRKLTGK